MDRTRFLKLLVHGGGAVVAAIVGIPALILGFSPVFKSRESAAWRALGTADAFPLNTVTHATVELRRGDWARALEDKGVYVWRPAVDQFVVFSRSCTDLSCPIRWDPGSEWFFCPCHGGIFDRNGERRAGPPRRPLFRYANRIQDGVVEIDLHSLPPLT